MGILQKPMFRQSIRDRRCIVIADAFIEGRAKKTRQPYLVYARHGRRPFGLAGIWDEWANPATGEITRSFAILTTVANELMQAIGHHRSPVVLDEEQSRRGSTSPHRFRTSPECYGLPRCKTERLPHLRTSATRAPTVPTCSTHRRPRLPGTRLRNSSGTGDVRHGRVRAATANPPPRAHKVPSSNHWLPVFPCTCCHSWFSLRYGLMQPRELLAEAQTAGITTLALTDINATSAHWDFVRDAPSTGFVPSGHRLPQRLHGPRPRRRPLHRVRPQQHRIRQPVRAPQRQPVRASAF